MKTPTKKELKIILRAVQSVKRRMHQAVQNDGGGKGMNQKLPAIIGIAGFVIFLGAEGDAYCNTGSYIIERAVIGVIMVVGGWAWAKIRAAHAGSTARTARKSILSSSVYTRKGDNVKC